MEIIGTFGRVVGMNPDAVVLEDGTKAVLSDDLYILGGSPLALYKDVDDNDIVKIASYKWLLANGKPANVKPYGIAKFSRNQYIDETYDKLGTYGSGRGTVIQLGRVTLLNNVYTTSSGNITDFAFDTSLVYSPGEALFVNLDSASAAAGKITNVAVSDPSDPAYNSMTLVGYVSNFFASPTNPVLEIVLK